MSKRIVVLFIFITSNFFIFSQEKKLSNIEFIEAKEGYLKISLSKEYLELREASQDFAYKLGGYYSLSSLENFEEFKKWIPTVIDNTKFKDIEEATNLMKLCLSLQEKIETDNSRIFELIKLASKEQVKEILEPEFATTDDIEAIKIRKREGN